MPVPEIYAPPVFSAPSVTVRLYGREANWVLAQRPVKALLFGQMVDRAMSITKYYRSDLFHDALFIEELTGPASFYWMVRESGTNIGESALIQEQISGAGRRILYWVELRVDEGDWSATFTEMINVPEYDASISVQIWTNGEGLWQANVHLAPNSTLTEEEAYARGREALAEKLARMGTDPATLTVRNSSRPAIRGQFYLIEQVKS